jgi:2-polyprenyl-6-methoxyphenol hydroxylase-like FAD-dependent oxidoreductase
MQTDVIIVGAGPTGLSLACQLVRHGIDFAIVEKNDGRTPFSKALGVHARTLEIYEQLGIAREAVAQGTIAGKVRLLEGGKVRGEADLSHLGEGLSPYPYMLVLEQNKNEKLLHDYIRRAGKDVLWGHELTEFSQTDDAVSATVRDRDGTTTEITGKYLVGCDGPHSPVRHGLGLTFEGSTFERLFYVADVRVDWAFRHDALQVCLVRNSIVAFFPMKGENRYRIVSAFPEGWDQPADEIKFDEIEQRIKNDVEVPLEISDVDWFSVYKVHARHVNRFSLGRCFLAGDAAHIHTPAGGQGMNTGIQDAYNLAWKLAFVRKGYAGEKILESYNGERLENAKRLLGTTDRMFSFAAGTDWLLEFIRTTIFPPLAKYIVASDVVRKRFFPLISQIGIQYRHHDLSRHDGDHAFSVKAGDRLPYCLVDGESLYDRLHAPTFHLLLFSDGQSGHDDWGRDVRAEFGDVLDCHVIPLYPHLADLFGSDRSFLVLVRPDNYIGQLSPDLSLPLVRSYFADIIGYAPPISRISPPDSLL